MLLRTFSKVHGLCGLRVGFGLCGSDALPRALDQVRQPFFCNALAQAAALEALSHQDAVEERVALTVAERTSVSERLRDLGLEVADSQANFCWLHLGETEQGSARDEAEIMRGLRDRGVLVRGGAALGSQTPALRVTCGLPEENDRFLRALSEVLEPAVAR
jgi:histidinol-phosphate aminotransferase